MESARCYNAKALRRLKPVVKNINFYDIFNKLWDMQEECSSVKWFTTASEGREVIINALDGDEDEALEFEMAFCDLDAEIYEFIEELKDLKDTAVSEFFDRFYGAAGCASDSFGDGFMGFDPVENDYISIYRYDNEYIEESLKDSLSKMSKKDLFEYAGICTRIFTNYISLTSRYENLERAMKILSGENLNILKDVTRVNELYDQSQNKDFSLKDNYKWQKEWDCVINNLPSDAWLY